MFGGLTLIYNNMTGSAVPQMPNIYQESGWLIVTIFLAVFASISALCSLFIVEAMQAIPGNKHFQGTVEFGTLIHFYFGKWAHIIGQVMLAIVIALSQIEFSESVWMQIEGAENKIPTVGDSSGFGGLVGVIMLNFSFCASVPSWINIKYPMMGRIVGYCFSLIILLPSIPMFMLIEDANLKQNFTFKKPVLLLLCYVIPVLAVIPLMNGSGLTALNVWASLIFVSTANFIVPLLIYLQAIKFRKKYNETRELTHEQKLLLKKIHWQSKTINQFIDQYDAIRSKVLKTRASSMFLSGAQRSLANDLGSPFPESAMSILPPSAIPGIPNHPALAKLRKQLSNNANASWAGSEDGHMFPKKPKSDAHGLNASTTLATSDPNISAVNSVLSMNAVDMGRGIAYPSPPPRHHSAWGSSSGLLVPTANRASLTATGPIAGPERPLFAMTSDGGGEADAVGGSSGTIASDSAYPFSSVGPARRSSTGESAVVGMGSVEAHLDRRKVSLVVLDEDGLPAITVDPPNMHEVESPVLARVAIGVSVEEFRTDDLGVRRQASIADEAGGPAGATILGSPLSLSSLPNSGRSSVIGGTAYPASLDRRSVPSIDNSTASRNKSRMKRDGEPESPAPGRAMRITFDTRSRESSSGTSPSRKGGDGGPVLPRLALNDDEAAMEADEDNPYAFIEAFLLEDVPDPDMEDVEEECYNFYQQQLAMAVGDEARLDEGSPGGEKLSRNPSDEIRNGGGSPAASPGGRPRLPSLAALFRSRDSLNLSQSNLSRAGSSVFGFGSLRSLTTSVVGLSGGQKDDGTAVSPGKKKRPPRARMGSARSNFSFASDASSRKLGNGGLAALDEESASRRNSSPGGHRIISIDSISVVDEEVDEPMSVPKGSRNLVSSLRTGSLNVVNGMKTPGSPLDARRKADNEKNSSQDTADEEKEMSSGVPALVVVEPASDDLPDLNRQSSTLAIARPKPPNLLIPPRGDSLAVLDDKSCSRSERNGSTHLHSSPFATPCASHLQLNKGDATGSSFVSLKSAGWGSHKDNASFTKLTGSFSQLPHRHSRPSSPYLGSATHSHGNDSGGAATPSGSHQYPSPLMRRRSLPTHPDFVCKAFRSVPKWVPVKAKIIAIVCIILTSLTSLGNLGYNIATVVQYYRQGSIGPDGEGNGIFTFFGSVDNDTVVEEVPSVVTAESTDGLLLLPSPVIGTSRTVALRMTAMDPSRRMAAVAAAMAIAGLWLPTVVLAVPQLPNIQIPSGIPIPSGITLPSGFTLPTQAPAPPKPCTQDSDCLTSGIANAKCVLNNCVDPAAIAAAASSAAATASSTVPSGSAAATNSGSSTSTGAAEPVCAINQFKGCLEKIKTPIGIAVVAGIALFIILCFSCLFCCLCKVCCFAVKTTGKVAKTAVGGGISITSAAARGVARATSGSEHDNRQSVYTKEKDRMRPPSEATTQYNRDRIYGGASGGDRAAAAAAIGVAGGASRRGGYDDDRRPLDGPAPLPTNYSRPPQLPLDSGRKKEYVDIAGQEAVKIVNDPALVDRRVPVGAAPLPPKMQNSPPPRQQPQPPQPAAAWNAAPMQQQQPYPPYGAAPQNGYGMPPPQNPYGAAPYPNYNQSPPSNNYAMAGYQNDPAYGQYNNQPGYNANQGAQNNYDQYGNDPRYNQAGPDPYANQGYMNAPYDQYGNAGYGAQQNYDAAYGGSAVGAGYRSQPAQQPYGQAGYVESEHGGSNNVNPSVTHYSQGGFSPMPPADGTATPPRPLDPSATATEQGAGNVSRWAEQQRLQLENGGFPDADAVSEADSQGANPAMTIARPADIESEQDEDEGLEQPPASLPRGDAAAVQAVPPPMARRPSMKDGGGSTERRAERGGYGSTDRNRYQLPELGFDAEPVAQRSGDDAAGGSMRSAQAQEYQTYASPYDIPPVKTSGSPAPAGLPSAGSYRSRQDAAPRAGPPAGPPPSDGYDYEYGQSTAVKPAPPQGPPPGEGYGYSRQGGYDQGGRVASPRDQQAGYWSDRRGRDERDQAYDQGGRVASPRDQQAGYWSDRREGDQAGYDQGGRVASPRGQQAGYWSDRRERDQAGYDQGARVASPQDQAGYWDGRRGRDAAEEGSSARSRSRAPPQTRQGDYGRY
ncbi:hypothetical protein HDU96_008175 [Phlyctochytrium bullatum]|nr:hypothetical protein HDU96_008175 [Phlyctochytrium bullatum]